MERKEPIHTGLSTANFYAVELLESILGIDFPPVEIIAQVEQALKDKHFTLAGAAGDNLKASLWNYPSPYRILIASPNIIEVNAIASMFKTFCIDCDYATDYEEFLHRIKSFSSYNLFILSDELAQFIGIYSHIKEYLQQKVSQAKRTKKIIVCLTKSESALKEYMNLGFDHTLISPILLRDLRQIVIKFYKTK